MQAPDALTLAVELGKVLEAAQLPYAIRGALALGVHGVSRSTQDVDLNVFVTPDRLEVLLAALQANGVQVDAAKARSEGLTVGRHRAPLQPGLSGTRSSARQHAREGNRGQRAHIDH